MELCNWSCATEAEACAGRVSARTFSRLELPAIVMSVSGDRVAEVQDAGQAAVPVALLSPNKAAGCVKSWAMMVVMMMMQDARRWW